MVDRGNGLVSRRIFFDAQTYELELERIFATCWLYLGHESELPAAGDYVARTLGNDPVILVRRTGGELAAFLNSCRHRGAKLCRSESGNVKAFVCPYHGWSYDLAGTLRTTRFDNLYPATTSFADWGLVPVPRLESYRGLVFGCWDAGAPALSDYLGDFRWYLDMFFARTPGGMDVLAPPQRSRIQANWKIPASNFLDNQHVYTTHAGPFALDPPVIPRAERMTTAMDAGAQVWTRSGHSITLLVSKSETSYRLYPSALHELYERCLEDGQKGILRELLIAVATVFPNLSFLERSTFGPDGSLVKSIILRQWQPIGPTQTEIVSWGLAEHEASPEYKRVSLANGSATFGIAGVFEQDDVELWASIGASSGGRVAANYPFNFQTALPMLEHPVAGHPGPGDAYQPFEAEINQFRFFLHWDELMKRGT